MLPLFLQEKVLTALSKANLKHFHHAASVPEAIDKIRGYFAFANVTTTSLISSWPYLAIGSVRFCHFAPDARRRWRLLSAVMRTATPDSDWIVHFLILSRILSHKQISNFRMCSIQSFDPSATLGRNSNVKLCPPPQNSTPSFGG